MFISSCCISCVVPFPVLYRTPLFIALSLFVTLSFISLFDLPLLPPLFVLFALSCFRYPSSFSLPYPTLALTLHSTSLIHFVRLSFSPSLSILPRTLRRTSFNNVTWFLFTTCRCHPAEARWVFENGTLRKSERSRVSILLILLEHPKTLLTSTTLEDGASLTTTKYCQGWAARLA